jgi:hypothetical protein
VLVWQEVELPSVGREPAAEEVRQEGHREYHRRMDRHGSLGHFTMAFGGKVSRVCLSSCFLLKALDNVQIPSHEAVRSRHNRQALTLYHHHLDIFFADPQGLYGEKSRRRWVE